jgi:hypothetical protein
MLKDFLEKYDEGGIEAFSFLPVPVELYMG